MKKIILVLCVLSTVFACQMPEVELKPVNNKVVAECLIKDITYIKGSLSNSNFTHEITKTFTYNQDGNPIQISEGNISLVLEYEKKRLKKVSKRLLGFTADVGSYWKEYEINNDFSIMIIHSFERFPYERNFNEYSTKKIHFVRDTFNLNELRISKIQSVYKKDNSFVDVGLPKHFFYSPKWTEKISNLDNVYLISADKSNKVENLEFWGNVKNPFSANIWLSLVEQYNKGYNFNFGAWPGYRYEDYDLPPDEDNGSWSRYMPKENKDKISIYETNAQGYPCKQTNRQPNFQPYPLEIRYSYCNCDCKY